MKFARTLGVLIVPGLLAACGGGGGGSSGGGNNNPPPPPPTHTIGGTVTGLSGTGLVLRNNGGDDLAIAGDGAFTFSTEAESSDAYSIAVSSQPTNPSQTCTIANGSGTIGQGNVTDVAVTCATNSYTIGATVSGLGGSGLVLLNNGGDEFAIATNGSFVFPTPVPSGETYDIRVLTHPAGPAQRCTVTAGSGTVTNSAVTSPAISCVTQHSRFAYSLDYSDESISIYAVDEATGQLRPRGHAWVGVHPVDGVGDGTGKFAYILNQGSATLSAFAHDDVTGALSEVAGSPYATGAAAEGANRVTIHPDSRFVYVTNGDVNNVAAFEINTTTGALTAVPGSPFAAGTNPSLVTIDAGGTFAYVVNRDSNDIYTYLIDATTGALTEVAGSRVSTGKSPMVLVLHPNGRFAYVTNTEGDSVSAFKVNAASGVLTAVTGSPFAAGTNPADTPTLHSSGKFLYVRNNGPADDTGSISAFAIDPDSGALSPIGTPAPIGVNANYQWMDPAGRFLFVANRGPADASTPGSISAFRIDGGTGALTALTGVSGLTPAPYSVSVDPSGKFVYAASTAGNVLYSYALDSDGDLTPLDQGSVIVSRDQPISLVAYSSRSTPQPVVFSSKFAYVPNTASNSISGYSIDATTGELTATTPVASLGDGPQSVAVHPNSRFLLGVNATGANRIASYPINATTGALSAAGSSLATGGTLPTAVAVQPNGRSVYLAHHVVSSLDGSENDLVTAHSVDPVTGALAQITGTNAMNPANGPIVAMAIPPNGRFVYAVTDDSWGFATIDRDTGGFSSAAVPGATAAAGGASAIAIDPNGCFAYIAIVGDPGSIEIYSIIATGVSLPSLAGGLQFQATQATGSTPRSIAIDPTGRFLYTANSGDDTVSQFTIDRATGTLAAIDSPVSAGANPISVSVDYSGHYAYVVSQDTNQVLMYTIDATSGALTQMSATATGDTPNAIAVSADIQ